MRIDGAALLIVFLAVILARMFKLGAFTGGSSTAVGAVTQSPAAPIVTYENPIDKFIAERYPEARR